MIAPCRLPCDYSILIEALESLRVGELLTLWPGAGGVRQLVELVRLLAVDPSLTCSGWAVFSIVRKELLAVGKIRSAAAENLLADRLLGLQKNISEMLEQLSLGEGDVLICEAPTTMRDPKAAFKVEQVRCMFEILGRQRGALVPGRVNPRTVQYELLGQGGKQLGRKLVKHSAAQTVRQLYARDFERLGFPTELEELQRQQDIVDAILLGTLALARIEEANRAQLDLGEVMGSEERRSTGRGLKFRMAAR